MASMFPDERHEREGKIKLCTRKGHDMTWSCDIHGEPIKFYCKEHKIPLCHPCATKDHQKPCHLDNIGDVIPEMGKELDDKILKIEEYKTRLQKLDSRIQSSATSESIRLQRVSDMVSATYEDKLKSGKDKEQEQIRLINEEADEEIRIINEKRDKRIKASKEEAEQQQLIIKETQAKLMSETKTIKDVVHKKIEDLTSKTQHAIGMMENVSSKIVRLKKNDETFLNEGPHVIALLEESLSENVYQEVAISLHQIHREVQRVQCVEGEVGGEHYSRIDGYFGKWGLVKTIDIPLIVNYPLVRGLISSDEICVRDTRRNDLYVTNISNKRTEKDFEGHKNMRVTSCAPIDSNVIVCGKWRRVFTGDSLDGCITLYDRQWKVVRDITIPRYPYSNGRVYVDVGKHGIIIAAQRGQSNICVINPADGKIVKTITLQGEKVRGWIQALPSGDIVVQTGLNKFFVISRSGEVNSEIECDGCPESRCFVDKLTGTLYITYYDTERNIYAVDHVSCNGDILEKSVIEYDKSDRCDFTSPCLVTPSGNLIACNGGKLFVYKKSFIV